MNFKLDYGLKNKKKFREPREQLKVAKLHKPADILVENP